MKTTSKNSMVCAISFCLALVAGCSLNVNRISTQKSGSIESAGISVAKVNLDDMSGNITVTGTSEARIKATITVSELQTSSSNESAAENLSVRIDTANGAATMGYSFSGNGDSWELLRLEDIGLSCDKSLNLDVKSTNGNITVSDMNALCTLSNVNGNITATLVRGGALDATNGNLDVTLHPDSLFAKASFKTTNGNIKIKVASGFKANLDLSTTNGTVKVPDNKKESLNGGGTAVLECSTTNGNITIEFED
jgi:DUF4097 and DUF4098 domain-containing protein YvlB